MCVPRNARLQKMSHQMLVNSKCVKANAFLQSLTEINWKGKLQNHCVGVLFKKKFIHRLSSFAGLNKNV